MNEVHIMEVLSAYMNGEDIQAKYTQDSWDDIRGHFNIEDLPDVRWDFYRAEYRIKPKPKEFWVNEYEAPNGKVKRYVHLTKEDAYRFSGEGSKGYTGIVKTYHMVESDE